MTEIQFTMKNTVGWDVDAMQEHVWECHEEVKRLRGEVASLIREKQLWTWIHEEMGCFLQHSATLDDTCKWVVLDVDGPSAITSWDLSLNDAFNVVCMRMELAVKHGFTQKQIAQSYALALRSSWPTDWPKVNKLIIDRWSASGLERIKKMAWSGSCFEKRAT